MSSTVVPVGDEAAHDVPHGAAAARVEAGRRLVEEDHARRRRPASSRGRGGAACRRSRWRAACGRPRRGRTARAARRPGPSTRFAPRWRSRAISSRFSSPVSSLSTAENWPVRPIAARTPSGSRTTSQPATVAAPASGRTSVRQDVHGRRLAGAVRAEQRGHRAGRDGQVDAVEHDLVAVRLPQPADLDRRVSWVPFGDRGAHRARRTAMSPNWVRARTATVCSDCGGRAVGVELVADATVLGGQVEPGRDAGRDADR